MVVLTRCYRNVEVYLSLTQIVTSISFSSTSVFWIMCVKRIREERLLSKTVLWIYATTWLVQCQLGPVGQVALPLFAAALIKQAQATSESRSFFHHTVPLSKIMFECVRFFCIFKWF